MQAPIRELRQGITSVLMFVITGALVSCATPKEPGHLVDDPAEKKESLVPWNKPEPWESGGNLAGMTDRR